MDHWIVFRLNSLNQVRRSTSTIFIKKIRDHEGKPGKIKAIKTKDQYSPVRDNLKIEKHRKIAAMAIRKVIINHVENYVLIFNVFYTTVKDKINYTTFDIQNCTTPRGILLLTSHASKTELFN
jgi:hypothetical protein